MELASVETSNSPSSRESRSVPPATPRTGLPSSGSAPQPLAGLPSSESAPQPLAGLRVVEFTHMVMGPTCGMVLADMGAEVIKVEPPTGDPMRAVFSLAAGADEPRNPPFDLDNRGKRSVVLDRVAPALDAPGRLDPRDGRDEERAGEVVHRRKRVARLVVRPLLGDGGRPAGAARRDAAKGARSSAELSLHERAVIHRRRW